MRWREFVAFLSSFLPTRVWTVEYDGVRIAHGPWEFARDEYNDLMTNETGEVRLYSRLMTKRGFQDLAESGGR